MREGECDGSHMRIDLVGLVGDLIFVFVVKRSRHNDSDCGLQDFQEL